MIVDASAILSILLREDDRSIYQKALAYAPAPIAMSPVNFVEAAIRCDKLGDKTRLALDELLQLNGIEIAATTPDQARLACEAYQQFGKGNHPAKLNLGDCFAYALAKARREPLLFKGDDFRMTDIEAAI